MSIILKGGRLRATRRDVVRFTSSIRSDRKIAEAVVKINEAHTVMLAKRGIIDRRTAAKLLRALTSLEGKLPVNPDLEDIHVNLEEVVLKRVGMEVGGSIHAAKSRNDQVATAIRMTLREQILVLSDKLLSLYGTLLQLAERHTESIFPGYSHLQPAQPITFAHYLIAKADSLSRDLERLGEAYRRVNLSPMGAGAIAGTSFPIDREMVADMLGFDGLAENTLDAVESRDFVLECQAALSILAVDLSRMAEDLIFYSSPEVSAIELPDEFASTSTIMPQKKNPEVLEVIRARCAQVIGNMTASASTLHSLPSGYNLDLQEITPLLWASVETIAACVDMLTKLIAHIKPSPHACVKQQWSFTASTELANLLTRKFRIPFRLAHKIVGATVLKLIEENKPMAGLTPEFLKSVAFKISKHRIDISEKDIATATNLLKFVKAHKTRGGPSPSQTRRTIAKRKKELLRMKKILEVRRLKLRRSDLKLRKAIRYFI